MTPIPDAAAIRTLDGPALTVLACELGLAPAGFRPGDPWSPHLHLAQAYGVLDALAARGWETHLTISPDGSGNVWVGRGRSERSHQSAVRFGRDEELTRAHALLLVAVLAVVSSKQEVR
jgi:hypothetical protein